MIGYLLAFAGGALVASLWWLLRMRRSTQHWEYIADLYGREIGDANRTIKQQKAALRLLGVIESTARAEAEEPARQNGRRKGAHAQ